MDLAGQTCRRVSRHSGTRQTNERAWGLCVNLSRREDHLATRLLGREHRDSAVKEVSEAPYKEGVRIKGEKDKYIKAAGRTELCVSFFSASSFYLLSPSSRFSRKR